LKTSAALAGASVASGTAAAASDAPVTDGLVMHLDAADINASDGDSVSNWPDISGNGNDATQSKNRAVPTYDSSGVNGSPAVEFDGRHDWLDLNDSMTDVGSLTVFAVGTFRDVSRSQDQYLLAGQANGNPNRCRIANYDWNDSWNTRVGDSGDITYGSQDTNAHLWTVRSDVQTWLDGGEWGSASNGATGTPNGFNLGSYEEGSGSHFQGWIAEVLVYNRELSDSEVSSVNDYLLNEYGISASDGGGCDVSYSWDGRSTDAAWRDDAEARIDQYRKADLTVNVVDSNGDPVSDATVDVTQQEHEFNFGTTVHAGTVADNDSSDGDNYRQIELEEFNYSTFETHLKAYNWEGDDERHKDVEETIKWLNNNDQPARGHAAVWEDFDWMTINDKQSPSDIDREVKKEIRDRVVPEEEDITFEGRFRDWDMHNHPIHKSEIRDKTGNDAVPGWWNEGRQSDSVANFGTNEMNIIQKYDWSSGWESKYESFIDSVLLDQGVSPDAIGAMCHSHIGVASRRQSPTDILSILDRFWDKYGLPFYISEFHVELDSDTYKDACQEEKDAQADYLRDFYIACFSHQSVDTIVHWNFWAGKAWREDSCLYNEDWTRRQHGQQYLDLVYTRWWTDTSGTTDSSGTYSTRAFKGEHKVTATDGSASGSASVTLSDGGTTVEIQIS